MGFFSKLFSAIDDSVQKVNYYVTHPSEAMALKEDLVTPRDVSYAGFFKKVDPILDTVDPMHNIVQTATTGSSTTEGQLPYFEKIAPVIVSAFFPVAGALASGVNGVSEGNTQQAVIGFTGYAVGSYASAMSQANANLVAQGATADTTMLTNLQTAQTLGKLVSTGVGVYNLYDAQDQLKASTGKIANMVSDTQQSTPVYSQANIGTAYGVLSGDGRSTTGAVIGAQQQSALMAGLDNRAILFLGLVAFFLWSKK